MSTTAAVAALAGDILLAIAGGDLGRLVGAVGRLLRHDRQSCTRNHMGETTGSILVIKWNTSGQSTFPKSRSRQQMQLRVFVYYRRCSPSLSHSLLMSGTVSRVSCLVPHFSSLASSILSWLSRSRHAPPFAAPFTTARRPRPHTMSSHPRLPGISHALDRLCTHSSARRLGGERSFLVWPSGLPRAMFFILA